MSARFTFLSNEEFARLGSSEKLAYLSAAMNELDRAKVPPTVRGWHSLFLQRQQQQQPQPKDDSGPPDPEQDQEAMHPEWVFACEPDGTWAWSHSPRGGAINRTGKPFPTMSDAADDAKRHGFDPLASYWVANAGGQANHFRPGKPPLQLPSGQTPPD